MEMREKVQNANGQAIAALMVGCIMQENWIAHFYIINSFEWVWAVWEDNKYTYNVFYMHVHRESRYISAPLK